MLSFLRAYGSKCHFHLLFFYSSISLLSRYFIPFFFLSSLILPQTLPSTHLFFHSFFFSLLWLFSLLFSLADLCCYGFFYYLFCSDLMGGFGNGWLLSSVQPRCATKCWSLLLWVFFFGSDLMGGFSSGWFLLPFSLAAPPDADLYCCGFFFFGSD